MARLILLTGHPGVGKTTVIRRLAQALGSRAGGFYTEELRIRGPRVGFKIVTLEGTEGTLAHVDIKGSPRVGRYGVNLSDLDQIGVAAIQRALAEREVVIIDEIGKMELFSDRFREAVERAAASDRTVVATAMAQPNPFVDRLKARAQAQVVKVTEANRQALPAQLLTMIESPPPR
ncbi:MAG: NTPase [Chloroflexi bacterium]|nr:NTPase [Chloroflexota bacterium]